MKQKSMAQVWWEERQLQKDMMKDKPPQEVLRILKEPREIANQYRDMAVFER